MKIDQFVWGMFYGLLVGGFMVSVSCLEWWESMQSITLVIGIVFIVFYLMPESWRQE